MFVTGASGFLGRVLCKKLEANGEIVLRDRLELLDYHKTLNGLSQRGPLDVLFHVSGWNGGISFNALNQFDIFYQNTVMGLNVLKAANACGVKKVVSVVASCAYPEEEFNDDPSTSWKTSRDICIERDFFDGPPHKSVACHGYAKRNLQLASQFYHEQYGLDAVCVCPTTLFGPGDSVDPNRTKVLMAVVKKVVDAHRAKSESITFWGSGNAYREFLFVEDAARLIVMSTTRYSDSSIPLNLGTGHEFRIRELVAKVVDAVGYMGSIEWDTSKPDGQLRKRLDLSRMEEVIPGFTPTDFNVALKRTIDWYTSQSQ